MFPSLSTPTLTVMWEPGVGPVASKTSWRVITALTGAARFLGQHGDRGLEIGWNLASEPAADLHRHDLDLGGGLAENPDHLVADAERSLRAAPDRDPVVRVPEPGGDLRLNVSLVHCRRVEFALDNEVRLGKSLFHVSLDLPKVLGNVALSLRRFSHLRCTERLVQDRRSVRHALGRGQDRIEHLVLHLDLVGGLFGDMRTRRGNGGYCMALVERLVGGEHVVAKVAQVRGTLSERDDLVGHFRQVSTGDDGVYAVHGLGFTGVNREDFGVSVGTANELSVQDIVRVEVRSVLGASGHLVGPVMPNGPRPDNLVVALLENHVGFVCGGHSNTSLRNDMESPESVRASWYQGKARSTIFGMRHACACFSSGNPGNWIPAPYRSTGQALRRNHHGLAKGHIRG